MSAYDNFNSTQNLISQMMQPQQAGQQPQMSPIGAGNTTNMGQPQQAGGQPMEAWQSGSVEGFKDYQNRLAGEENKATILAKQMRDARDKAQQASIASAAQSQRHAEQLKAMGKHRIQAKHPLDLLAIGIQGWKMRKLDKKATASATQAAQDAAAAQQAESAAEQQSKRAELLYKQRLENQKPVTPTEASQVAAYNLGLAAGQSYDDMSEEAQAGYHVQQHKLKVSRDQGVTGERVKLPAAVVGKQAGEIFATEAGRQSLTEGVKQYDPEYMGLSGAFGGVKGRVLDFLGIGQMEGDMGYESVQFNADRAEFRQGLYTYANQLIKARSGAAVTQQEFDRFLKEFALSPNMGAQEFEKRMDDYITEMGRENYKKLRQGGWAYDEYGALVEKEGAPAIKSGKQTDETFWDEYNAQRKNLPADLYNERGEFKGYSIQGDKMRRSKVQSAVEGEVAEAAPDAPPSPEQEQAAEIARYQQAIDYQKSLGDKGNVQGVIDLAGQAGLPLDAFK